MRLLCPYCQKAITVPDSEAGKEVNCPECQERFAAPQLYTPPPSALDPPAPSVAAPAAPVVPETPLSERPAEVPAPPLPEMPAPDRELSGFQRMSSVPVDPRVVRILPGAALFVALVLTFFSWNGLYPAGYPAYTQNAWQGLFAGLSRDAVADDELKIGDDLESRLRTTWWLLPYLLFLLPAVGLALAGPVVDLAGVKLPAGLERIWHLRAAVLGAFALLLLMFLLAQWASGLGLQRAVNEKVEADFAEQKAVANTPEKMQRWEMRVAERKGGYHVRTTPWLRLTILAHLLAAIAVVAEAGLALRGNKPPPRLAIMW